MELLKGILVLDFCQYLSGPSAALRLADLGARVIKIERPAGGDAGRRLILKNLVSDGDSVNFQAINRNKESFSADLKDPADRDAVLALIDRADVLLENFRPGVMEKLGLGEKALRARNPRLVYASITGYGPDGPWVRKPGQDLLLQAISGLAWQTGDADQPPVPCGLSLADSYAGTLIVQGILACLVRRRKTGLGGKTEISLLEALVDLQFEPFTTFLNDSCRLQPRGAYRGAHPYLSAPYGVYDTADGYLALAMGNIQTLAQILEMPELADYRTEAERFARRDEIKRKIAARLVSRTTAAWMERLEAADYWASPVYNWEQLMQTPAFAELDFILPIRRPGCETLYTTRCPLRINGETLKSQKAAPRLGQDTDAIRKEFGLPDAKEKANEGSEHA